MSTKFTAELENITLKEEAKKRITVGLQCLVLEELAKLDNRGDQQPAKLIKGDHINGFIMRLEKNQSISIEQLDKAISKAE